MPLLPTCRRLCNAAGEDAVEVQQLKVKAVMSHTVRKRKCTSMRDLEVKDGEVDGEGDGDAP